jgi:hypothetical protein
MRHVRDFLLNFFTELRHKYPKVLKLINEFIAPYLPENILVRQYPSFIPGE